MPALEPGRGLFRATSPPSVSPTESVARVRSPSPPKVRTPVKVPERFKSPEPPSKVPEQFRSPEVPPAPLSPEPALNTEREQNGMMSKSLVNGDANTNQTDSTEDTGQTRKKIVKVVRRVVRKVLPTEEDEPIGPNPPPHKAPQVAKPAAEAGKAVPAPASLSKASPMVAFSFKHDVIKTEDKDDISRGLTNLMVRGRTREPRPRVLRDDRPETVEVEKKNRHTAGKVAEPEEKKEDQTNLQPHKVSHKPTSPGGGVQDAKPPVAAVHLGSSAAEHSAPRSSKPAHSRPTSLPPVVGFIPAPKPSLLSPPPGFIPGPKPSDVKRNTTKSPPFATPVAPKNSSLAPLSHHLPAPTPSPPAAPVSPAPPCPNPSAPTPPPGVIPTQQTSISQQEVCSPHLACLLNIWDIGVQSA